MDDNESSCRICYCATDEALLHPCRCGGTLKHVHESCWIQWTKRRSDQLKDQCEVCGYNVRSALVEEEKGIVTWSVLLVACLKYLVYVSANLVGLFFGYVTPLHLFQSSYVAAGAFVLALCFSVVKWADRSTSRLPVPFDDEDEKEIRKVTYGQMLWVEFRHFGSMILVNVAVATLRYALNQINWLLITEHPYWLQMLEYLPVTNDSKSVRKDCIKSSMTFLLNFIVHFIITTIAKSNAGIVNASLRYARNLIVSSVLVVTVSMTCSGPLINEYRNANLEFWLIIHFGFYYAVDLLLSRFYHFYLHHNGYQNLNILKSPVAEGQRTVKTVSLGFAFAFVWSLTFVVGPLLLTRAFVQFDFGDFVAIGRQGGPVEEVEALKSALLEVICFGAKIAYLFYDASVCYPLFYFPTMVYWKLRLYPKIGLKRKYYVYCDVLFSIPMMLAHTACFWLTLFVGRRVLSFTPYHNDDVLALTAAYVLFKMVNSRPHRIRLFAIRVLCCWAFAFSLHVFVFDNLAIVLPATLAGLRVNALCKNYKPTILNKWLVRAVAPIIFSSALLKSHKMESFVPVVVAVVIGVFIAFFVKAINNRLKIEYGEQRIRVFNYKKQEEEAEEPDEQKLQN